jgi:hypothetical protein
MQHLFDLFVLPRPPGVRHVKAEEEEESEMNERMSKRIAANFENETEWRCENIERLGMEILGDSKTVVNWMCGEWQIRNKQYVRLVGTLQNTVSMLSGWGLTSPASGQNLYKHFFREGNERADKLSWEARGGQTITRWFAYDKFLSTRKTALRGAFDGGVSNEGCGGGWWLQIGVVGRGSSVQVDFPISSSSSSSSSSSCTSSHSFHWHDVAEEAMSLPPGSTVTCCELAACAALTRAAAKVACALLRPT